MRQHTSSKSLKKIEATRVCMVNKSHKYIQDAIVRYDTSIANLTFN